MLRWVVIACAGLLALVGAYECPEGGRCEDGQTCCKDPVNGYECCPFEEAECCEDHAHCCPAGSTCDVDQSSCVNATGSFPWAERASANQPRVSKSFRMIKSNMGEEDDNICPDESHCPAEFSCLKALTRFGCCPLAQGIPCSDGKHCCSEGHQCSADSRSCIKKDTVTTVLCSDGVSECPDETTCCETPEGKWGCCPMAKAVCCDDKIHCCPEGSTCDVEHSKCISSSTKKEMPMWAKLPARMRAEWENQKEDKPVSSETVDDDEKAPLVPTVGTLPPSNKEVNVSVAGNDVPCDDTVACADSTTCCKTKEGGWACCPLPEAVCCEDFLHCCPNGKKCNLAAKTCDDDQCSVPWLEKTPAIPRQGGPQVGNVSCDTTSSCPDGTTCCKNTEGGWACCPLPEAVCCNDHMHCCPTGTTCNLQELTCDGEAGSTPMRQKMTAFGTEEEEEDDDGDHDDDDDDEEEEEEDEKDDEKESNEDEKKDSAEEGDETDKEDEEDDDDDKYDEEDEDDDDDEDEDDEDKEEMKDLGAPIQCDAHTSCPQSTTCCFMSSAQKWGCCPLPKAVCCRDGSHCCPSNYRCDEENTTCVKGEVTIPWYTKIPATSSGPDTQRCDDHSQCPDQTTCCKLSTGDWGCCPLPNAVCCVDQEHCCPQGYTCNIASNSCQRIIMLQVQSVPLTPVSTPDLPLPPSTKQQDVKCDDETSCHDGQTCCKLSATEWGCCPFANAVCCSDMLHCCPAGYTCTGSGDCTKDTALHWNRWNMFLDNKKRALIV